MGSTLTQIFHLSGPPIPMPGPTLALPKADKTSGNPRELWVTAWMDLQLRTREKPRFVLNGLCSGRKAWDANPRRERADGKQMWGCCKPCSSSALGPPLRIRTFCWRKLMGETVPRHRGSASCHPCFLTPPPPLRMKHSFSYILRKHVCLSCPLLCSPLALSLYVTCLSYSVPLSQTFCLSCLCLSLLCPGCFPRLVPLPLNAWINLPISLNPWGEEQEEPAKGRQQPRFPSSQLGLGGLRPRISHLPSGL